MSKKILEIGNKIVSVDETTDENSNEFNNTMSIIDRVMATLKPLNHGDVTISIKE